MKAVSVVKFGSSEVLELREAPDPRPGPGQVLVDIAAIGVGYVDVMAREGGYPAFPTAGFVPGLEVAGRVTELGAGVAEQWRGRRVFAILRTGGGYAELVALSTDQLIPLPDGVSARDAVALGMNGLVARIAVERASVMPGESAFIRGAGGGIGIMAVQICAARGAHVTATTSSTHRGNRLRELGADRILDRLAAGESDSQLYDVVVDTVAGPELGAHFARLRPNGRYVLCGGVGGAPPPTFGADLLDVFHRSPTFFAFSLNSFDDADIVAAGIEMFADADREAITPVIHLELPLAEAASAHQELEDGRVFGKVVLVP